MKNLPKTRKTSTGINYNITSPAHARSQSLYPVLWNQPPFSNQCILELLIKSWVAQVWLKSHAEECLMHAKSDSGPVIEHASQYERLSRVPERRLGRVHGEDGHNCLSE